MTAAAKQTLTMCAIGQYTHNENKLTNIKNAVKLILSARAPEMTAGVITANFIWKMTRRVSGMVGHRMGSGASLTLRRRKNVTGLPMKPPHESP